MNVILRPLLRYGDFSGRASRAEYWLFGLVQSIVYGFVILLAVLSMAGVRENPTGAFGGAILSLGVAALLAVGLFIPNLALLARRMHDINMSAWWMGLMVPTYLAQWANFRMAFQAFQASRNAAGPDAMQHILASSAATSSVLGVIAAGCGLALFVIVLIPGNKGPNRYGNDPKDGGNGPQSRLPVFDEARIDAAIAELKAEAPYKPVFDFGPGSEDKPMVVAREAAPAASATVPQAPSNAPVSTTTRYGITDARPTFGRRR